MKLQNATNEFIKLEAARIAEKKRRKGELIADELSVTGLNWKLVLGIFGLIGLLLVSDRTAFAITFEIVMSILGTVGTILTATLTWEIVFGIVIAAVILRKTILRKTIFSNH